MTTVYTSKADNDFVTPDFEYDHVELTNAIIESRKIAKLKISFRFDISLQLHNNN